MEEVKEETPIIEDPEAERSMSSASAEAVADLERQLVAGEGAPVLSDEEAERKLKENTEKEHMSAAKKREEKKRVEEGETGSL